MLQMLPIAIAGNTRQVRQRLRREKLSIEPGKVRDVPSRWEGERMGKGKVCGRFKT